jgi:hypothetical protein
MWFIRIDFRTYGIKSSFYATEGSSDMALRYFNLALDLASKNNGMASSGCTPQACYNTGQLC